jgi:hypothetical protein
MRPLTLASLGLLWGCATADAPSSPAVEAPITPTAVRAPALLISPGAWRAVSADADPFADRPGTVICPADSHGFERVGGGLGYEVDTGACNYLTVAQPILADLQRGDRLTLKLWHYALTAPEPASAHVALWLDDAQLWEADIAIPSATALYTPVLEVPHDIPAGTPLLFHLHNHGANHWALVDLIFEEAP